MAAKVLRLLILTNKIRRNDYSTQKGNTRNRTYAPNHTFPCHLKQHFYFYQLFHRADMNLCHISVESYLFHAECLGASHTCPYAYAHTFPSHSRTQHKFPSHSSPAPFGKSFTFPQVGATAPHLRPYPASTAWLRSLAWPLP